MSPVNKQAVAAAFGRAAQSYSQHDELQRLSARGLLAALGEGRFAQVLDAGCGPGGNSRYWRATGSHVTALDLSAQMLDEARQQQSADRYLVADIEAIPLEDALFDLVWSHLAVQWCASLPQALRAIPRGAARRSGGLYHLAGKFVARAESGVEGSGCAAARQPVSLAPTGHSGAGRLALSQRGPDRHPRI